MAWLFLGSLLLGFAGSHEFRFLRTEPQRSRYRSSAWFILAMAWFPMACWIFNCVWPQN